MDTIEKRNNHALKCIQIETQLIYANLEAFVYILSGLGNIQSKVSTDVSLTFSSRLEDFGFAFTFKLLNVWKSFSNKISQLGQTYINKSSIQRANTIGFKNS